MTGHPPGAASEPWASQVNAALAELHDRLGATQRRCDELEARLEAVDASFLRHQGGTEDELASLRRALGDREQDVWRLEDELRRVGGRP